MSEEIVPTEKVETPAAGEKSAEKPSVLPRPESNEEGYYKRQFDKAQRELEKYQQSEEERKQAIASALEQVRAEKEAVEKQVAAARAEANGRVLNAEAKVQALAAGVRPERLEYALRLAELSGVPVSETGEPDGEALRKAIDAVVQDFPEISGGLGPTRGGSDFSGTAAERALSDETIRKMSTDELRRRMPEIEAYYASRRK